MKKRCGLWIADCGLSLLLTLWLCGIVFAYVVWRLARMLSAPFCECIERWLLGALIKVTPDRGINPPSRNPQSAIRNPQS